MKKGYIAGALFKEGDIKQRVHEKEALQKAVGDYIDFYNPITDNPSNDKSKLPTAKSIFNNDTKQIIDSEYIFAELDDEDAGVIAELGIAWGINYMRDLIIKGLAFDEIFNEELSYEKLLIMVTAILEAVPRKEVITHLSDIRVETAGEYEGKYVPFGYNQYVIGMIEDMEGTIYNSTEEAIEELENKIKK